MPQLAPRMWSVEDAWRAAVEVAAAAYGVAPATLLTQSRGRGPRPPKGSWEPKKTAVHLAVLLSDCDYAALARLVGLHRDTVASHCAAVRDACAKCDVVELQMDALFAAATTRLELTGARPTPTILALEVAIEAPHEAIDRIEALESYMTKIFSRARAALSDENSCVIRHFSFHPTASREREAAEKP